MKKLVITLLAAMMVMSGCASNKPAEKPAEGTDAVVAKDGVYEETVTGHNAPVTLSVTIAEGKVTEIIPVKEDETIGVGKFALEMISKEIIEKQTLSVDTVTGATITSGAVLSAVEAALTEAEADMEAWKAPVEKAPAEDVVIDTDVVVVGGGGSGLAAAISAEQAGAEVVVLEKLGLLGGSTNVSEGALNAVDDKRQKAQGIEDSLEKFYTQTFEGGHEVGTPELIKVLTENAYAGVEWMESIGITFKDEVGTATGALWQRSHYPTTPSGNSYIRVFGDYADKTDKIDIMMDTTAKELIVTDGRVTGVSATGREGNKVTVNAKKGVIIATGGFGGNVEMRQEYNTGVWSHVKLDSSIGCTNMLKSAQGDGIAMATAIGAEVTGMSDIQLHPCGTPGTGLMNNIRTSGRNRIFVNKEGNRFVNEGAARDVLAQAIFDQPESTYWVVVNAVRYPERDFVDRNGATIANMVAQGSVIEAETLEELAEKTEMSAENLKAAIDNYNAVVRGDKEDELGFKADNKADVEMTEGPWYACKKVPTVHHTMGGLKINTEAEVLDKEGNVIEGLFASGEVTGGIHGSNRLGGNAIAGTNAANNE